MALQDYRTGMKMTELTTILAGLHKGADAYEKPQPEIVAAIEAVKALVRHMVEGLPSTGASAVITGSRIEISIDIDALPGIVSGSCCTDGLDGLWKVTEPAIFAKEVCHALNDEREDGTTPVRVMFDKAFMAAIEQGAEGIEKVDDEAFETEAARLQEEARRSTGSDDGRWDDDAYDLKERLRDLVMLHAQDEIGCVPPPTKEQWAKAWANADEVFEP